MKILMHVAVAAVSLLLTGGAANAAVLHFSLSPGSYFVAQGTLNPASVTGSFDFNTATGALSNVDYTSVFGHYTTGSEYDAGVATQIYFGTFGTANYDVFQLSSSLSNGGTVQIFSGTNPLRFITAGGSFTTNATAAVPEPASWALMLVGFGLTGGAMRFRRRQTKVIYATT